MKRGLLSLFVRLTRLSSTYTENEANRTKTAGIIVIGDEILRGDIVDTNSSYMTPKLRNIGVQVKKISVIGDNLKEISEEVKIFSWSFNYVITTGGIGPTHDDITFEAVSKAFNEPLILHPELYKLCCEFYNTTDRNSPGMKLAWVPQSSKLTFADNRSGGKTNYPNVCVKNVYMFPGIPQLFQKSFDLLHNKLFQSDSKFYLRSVYFNVTEDKIATFLEEITKEFPEVICGSYPDIVNKAYRVKVTLESTNLNVVVDAHAKLLEIVPENFVVKMDDVD